MRPSTPSAPPAPAPLSLEELLAIALAHESLSPGALYLSLRGRVPRQVFWLHGVLALLLIELLANALMDIAGVRAELSARLVTVLLAWPFIAIWAKRLHDFNFRAWWLLASLVPGIGLLALLIANGCVPGTHGPNRFGSDPLAPRLSRPLPLDLPAS